MRSLNETPDLSNYIHQGYEDMAEDAEDGESLSGSEAVQQDATQLDESRQTVSRTSTNDGTKIEDEKVTPEMESRFFSPLTGNSRGNRLSMSDVADRHLRDKTDAIAYIIRNISDQCAAAVEGLHLAHSAENDTEADLASTATDRSHKHAQSDGGVSMRTDVSQLGTSDDSADHDSGHGESTGFLTPNKEGGRSRSRNSSIPPTPDLVGGQEGRSSTSMSGYSNSTAQTGPGADSMPSHVPGRDSMQPYLQEKTQGLTIVDVDDTVHDSGTDVGQNEIVKRRVRPATARMVPA